MDERITLINQNLLVQVDNLIAKEERINRALSGFKGYTPVNNFRNFTTRVRALTTTEQVQVYDTLIVNENWSAMITNLDNAIEKLEAASTLTRQTSRTDTLEINHINRHCPEGPPQELIDLLRIVIAILDLAAAIAQVIADFLDLINAPEFIEDLVQVIASALVALSRLVALIVAILVREANIERECEARELRELLNRIAYTTQETNEEVEQILARLECLEQKVDALLCRRY
jgi:hypothetical protein